MAGHNVPAADKKVNQKAIASVACGLDVTQTVLSVANFATAIRAASINCVKQETDKERALCSTFVNSVLSNLFFTAGFLGLSVSDCGDQVRMATACPKRVGIGEVTGTVLIAAMLEGVAASASSMKLACGNLWWNKVPVPITGVTKPPLVPLTLPPKPTRPKPTIPPLPTAVPSEYWLNNRQINNYETNVVACWFQTGEAFSYLARVGLALADSTAKCAPEYIGSHKKKGLKCAIDIVDAMAFINVAAAFLLHAVDSCAGITFPDDSNGGAACAAEILGTLGSTLMVTGTIASLNQDCPLEGLGS